MGTLGHSGESFEVETIWKEALGAQLRHQNFPFEETMTDFFNIIDFKVFHSI